jgi:hypothetical protein
MTDAVLLVRQRLTCPVCATLRCLTAAGRLWTHGPKLARCRGSGRTPEGARAAARDVRGSRAIRASE